MIKRVFLMAVVCAASLLAQKQYIVSTPNYAIFGQMINGSSFTQIGAISTLGCLIPGLDHAYDPSTQDTYVCTVAGAAGTSGMWRKQVSGTFTTTNVTEGSNLYFTNARVLSAMFGLYESPLTFNPNHFTRTTNAVAFKSCASDTSMDNYVWKWTLSGGWTCQPDVGASGSGITSMNGLNGAIQTFSKTDDTNVTLTITSSGTQHMFAMGWAGALSKARQHANTMYTDATYTDPTNFTFSLSGGRLTGFGNSAGLNTGTTGGTVATGNHNHDSVYERLLGNPGADGYMLSSTAAGTRSWVAPLTWTTLGGKPSTFPPSTHASTHGQSGGDAVSLDASQIATGIINQSRLPSSPVFSGTVSAAAYTTSGPYSSSGPAVTLSTGLAASRGACSTSPIAWLATDTHALTVCDPSTSTWGSTLNPTGSYAEIYNLATNKMECYTDTGASCAASSGSGTVNSGTTGQFAYYSSNGTVVGGHNFGSADLPPAYSIAATGGASNAYAGTMSSGCPGTYVVNEIYQFTADAANTGSATFNLCSLGAKTIKKQQGQANLAANDIRANAQVLLLYDGTYMQMTSQLGNSSSGLITNGTSSQLLTSDGAGGFGTPVTPPTGTLTGTIFSGTAVLGTSAITSGACATVVTVSATGVATTDVIQIGYNGDPTGVTGYGPSTSGGLTIYPYPSANNVNVKVCNESGSSITPGALTLNVRVAR